MPGAYEPSEDQRPRGKASAAGARWLLASVTVATVALVAFACPTVAPAGAADLGQLNSQLGAQQAEQSSLSASVDRLSQLIDSLAAQISLVQSREAAVRADLARDRATLTATHAALVRERALLALLRARLTRARAALARQLISSYENDRPDLISVVLNASGFTDLLENLDFLRRAERQQQSIITVTRRAKAQADRAARRLTRLEITDARIAEATAVRARALAGMNALLASRQSALAKARSAKQTALAASRARGQQLQAEIAQVRSQQAAAAQAAGSPGALTGGSPAGPALGPSGGWAIPYAIVLCESGGQNLPPNSAGASGYYQIIPSTWQEFGGSGPAAYLASKGEQDAVATRIWNGAGPSSWVCAGMVGIH
jgi:septal ring factor EnvC (AmiA/AmiB activator)